MKTKGNMWDRRVAWNLRVWELCIFLLLYTVFALLYSLALYLTSSGSYLPRTLADYSVKLLLTFPVWWLLFVKWKHWPDGRRIAIHFFLCPLFIAAWLYIYHAVVDFFHVGYLDGEAMWWDVYIPFLFYVVQFGIVHGYNFWKKNRMQQEREKELLSLAYQSEMNALKAQLQPHFLFNTLNSINEGLTAANEHVRERIARLADTVRYSLRVSQEDSVPLRDELHFIKDCLWLEQERFGERLRICYAIEEGIGDMTVPPMLLQPLVENAVKHGIARSIEGGTITITIRRERGKVVFEIADTGAGLNGTTPQAAFTKGIGLCNTRRRLRYLFDEDIYLAHNQPRGTRVYFSLPDTTDVI